MRCHVIHLKKNSCIFRLLDSLDPLFVSRYRMNVNWIYLCINGIMFLFWCKNNNKNIVYSMLILWYLLRQSILLSFALFLFYFLFFFGEKEEILFEVSNTGYNIKWRILLLEKINKFSLIKKIASSFEMKLS